MSVDRALRSVIRGILNEQDGPNDPRMPDEPAYTQLPSRIGIAAMLLPTAFSYMKGTLESACIPNEFPVTNIEGLDEDASQTVVEKAIRDDYAELSAFYSSLKRQEVNWPVGKTYGNLTVEGKTDIKSIIGVVMQPKCSGPTFEDAVIAQIGGDSTTKTDFIKFILAHIESAHKLFQNRVNTKSPRNHLIETEKQDYNNVVSYFRTLLN